MAVTQIGDSGPDGVNIGAGPTNKAAFYGVTPVAQRTSSVLATSLLSASSYVSVASNTAAILLELSAALIALGLYKTA